MPAAETRSPRRVCLIGGGFAQRYARAFASAADAEVVAVCTRHPESAATIATAINCRHYTDASAMLRLECPDIVVVATPNDLHHPLTMAALVAGAEVMCEKPLALDVAQAAEMTTAAARLGRRTSVGFTWRFLPACTALRSLIASGELGDIYHAELRYFTRGFGDVHGPMRWQYERHRAGSGALANLGSHAIDLLHWWFGDIARVAARTRTVIPTRITDAGATAAVSVEDVCAATYELSDGTPVALSVGWVAHIARVGLDVEVHGSNASAWLHYASDDRRAPMGRLRYCDESMEAPAAREVGGASPEHWSDLGQACVSRLVGSFLSDDESPAGRTPDFVDGLRAQCVIAATLAAGEGTRWEDVVYVPAAPSRQVGRQPRIETSAEAPR